MTFYLYFIISILILLFIDHLIKYKNIFFAAAVLLTVFVAGFRFEVGYDWFNYVSFYSIGMQDLMEPFFALSIKLLNLISSDFSLMFFSYSLATISVLLLTIQRFTNYPKTSFLLYLLVPSYFITSFSILRQGLALVIFLYALSFLLINNSKLKFTLISIVSIMFHYSAAVPFIIIILGQKLFYKNYKTIYYALIVTISWVLYYSNIAPKLLNLAYGRYAAYTDYTISVSSVKIAVINLFIFILIAFKKNYIKGVADTHMLNLLVFGTLITNVFADFVPMTRLSYYFYIVQIILVPKLIYSAKNYSIRISFLLVFLLYYCLMFAYTLNIDSNLDQYPKLTPYKNLLFDRTN